MNRQARDRSYLAGKRRLIVFILIAVVGLILFSFSSLALSGFRLNQQAEVLRREIGALKAENEVLQKEVRYLESDEGLEKLAREQLGWLKPGETGVVTVPSKTIEKSKTTPLDPRRRESPNWRHWWDLFFGG